MNLKTTLSIEEFEQFSKLELSEVISSQHMSEFAKSISDNISKSSDSNKDSFKKEFESFKKINVIGDKTQKTYYLRYGEIGWINKGLYGVYLDTELNRELNRVGLETGSANDIQKGKWAKEGEIRHWADGDYQRRGKTWVKVPKNGSDIKKENSIPPKISLLLENFKEIGGEYKINESKFGTVVTIKDPEGHLDLFTFKDGKVKWQSGSWDHGETDLNKVESLIKFAESKYVDKAPSKVDKVVEYMLEQGMQATNNQIISGAEGANFILSPKEIEEVKSKLLVALSKENKGGKYRLKSVSDIPISLHNLKGKELISQGTKTVKFASGDQVFHIFDVDGEKVEVPERFLNESSKLDELNDLLKKSKETNIIAATNSYKHTPETIEQLNNKFSILKNLEEYYTLAADKIDRKNGGEEAWNEWQKLYNKIKEVKNALIANDIATSASQSLQKYGADPRSDIGLFSDVRSLLYRAKEYEKKVLE